MLQLPDFKQKQIVIINPKKGSSINDLKFKNENIVLQREGKIINQVSVHKLMAVYVLGEATFTSVLVKKLKRFGVSVYLLNGNLEEYAAINAVADGNYLLRERQYGFKNDLIFAKNLVKNKCFNQLELMKKYAPSFFTKQAKSAYYKDLVKKIDSVESIDQLLGIEGSMSKLYFKEVFSKYKWYKRMPRAKVDITNVLMDIGYNLLFNMVDSLLLLHGFDTYKGIYHQLFFQRKSLSCDIMEPFRVLIDKSIVKAYRLKQISDKDFKAIKGQYFLKMECSKKYYEIFFNVLMDNKEIIFNYVKCFYFCMLNESTDYPFIKIKC